MRLYDLTLAAPCCFTLCDWACLSESMHICLRECVWLLEKAFSWWMNYVHLQSNMQHTPTPVSFSNHVCSHNRLGLWLFYSHLLHRHFKWNNSDGAVHRSLGGDGGVVCPAFVKEGNINQCPFVASISYALLQHFFSNSWNYLKWVQQCSNNQYLMHWISITCCREDYTRPWEHRH